MILPKIGLELCSEEQLMVHRFQTLHILYFILYFVGVSSVIVYCVFPYINVNQCIEMWICDSHVIFL